MFIFRSRRVVSATNRFHVSKFKYSYFRQSFNNLLVKYADIISIVSLTTDEITLVSSLVHLLRPCCLEAGGYFVLVSQLTCPGLLQKQLNYTMTQCTYR